MATGLFSYAQQPTARTASATTTPDLTALASLYPNAFGSIPQQIAMPSSQYSEAVSAVPGTAATGAAALGDINTELSGTLSPSTVNQLRDQAAAYGVSSGMPGMTPGSIGLNNLMRSMGLTSEGLVQHGLGDYNNFLGTLASTQLNPTTAADVSEWNSTVKSAPDPRQAGQLQLALAQAQMEAALNPAGGTGAGAGSVTPSSGPWWTQGNSFGASAYQTYHTPARA